MSVKRPWTLIALLLLIAAMSGLAARYTPITNHVVLIAAILAPYLVVAALVSGALFAVGRRFLLAGGAAAVAMALATAQLPMFVGTHTPVGDSAQLRVLSVNAMKGSADAEALVDLAVADADVLTLVEVTPDLVRRLAAAGLDATFAYRVIEPLDGTSGIGLWSRYPLSRGVVGTDYFLSHIHAEVAVPQAKTAPIVAAVHVPAPWPSSIKKWQRSIGVTGAIMGELSEQAGPGTVVVAGDFNSTYDMADFRALLGNGFHDATEQVGAGLSPTFPTDQWVPPLLGIDHVLVRNGEAASANTVEISGTDHRGVAATVALDR